MINFSIISLFSGAGGLDLGFKNAGFKTIWANEYDKTIWDTFKYNFPDVELNTQNITDVESKYIPNSIGLIGGPPCQSWSEAGSGRGINDSRGKLFYDYIRILKEKQPKFFLVENVVGILAKKHNEAFNNFLLEFKNANYNISCKLLDANDYGVPETRKRVIIVGYHNSINKTFVFPTPEKYKPTLKDAIYDLPPAVSAKDKNKSNGYLEIPNHEYMNGSFSTMYMSRNRVRSWDEPSFTIQAGGRHAPIHPQAPKMVFVEKDKYIFAKGYENQYRRLSVRECARIQTFPDSFVFKYNNISDGYKMIGNAVPVNLAFHIAKKIMKDLENYNEY
ncbi:DNA cytosine methyltransferase [Brachyspira innocens]|uniref:DNA (cytosine-5-)-methyltransferase n=1 Tax=Brachyspira innocens TaxID=13264 RepID=A0ABT8YVR3_9SPIR|nr:DNA cytosine methyltransferase [Brachyspira innocens]MDO6992495.1 DNA cytosine methyltransferase [Brachyspira innocens]MDO7019994.1 DNA cytosine methyltransferase [Brachyspira innocens]